MSADKEIRLGDVGTQFIVTVKSANGSIVDISGFTTYEIFFKKPNGESETKTAALYTDGTDGKITYTTVDGDIDVAGLWRMQARLSNLNSQYSSDIVMFIVYRNLV